MFEIKETVYTTDDLVDSPEVSVIYQNKDLIVCVQKMYELQYQAMNDYDTDCTSNLKESCSCDIKLGFDSKYGIKWTIYYVDLYKEEHELPNLNDLFYNNRINEAMISDLITLRKD